MSALHVLDKLPGRRKGRGFGLSVQVVSEARLRQAIGVSDGSYGWIGAFGTHFRVDPKEKLLAF